jgi:hypothetical protein
LTRAAIAFDSQPFLQGIQAAADGALTMAAKPRIKARTIDEYLATLPADQRAALEKLRKAIQAAAPQAEECISYGLAAFRRQAAGGIWCDRQPLRLLSNEFDYGCRSQGRPCELRDQHGHHPLSSGQAAARGPGAKAGQGAGRRERGEKGNSIWQPKKSASQVVSQ